MQATRKPARLTRNVPPETERETDHTRWSAYHDNGICVRQGEGSELGQGD